MANKDIITEVKAGQTGYGLLVERDGYMSSDSDTINQVRDDIKNSQKFVIPDKFIVSAVFQKFGIKNTNGRIYPEAILKREVDKYITNRVANRCAIGALNHPSCQLADTKVLTEKGWKFISDVEVGENILTITPEKKIEIHPIVRKIEEPYSGRMIRLKSRLLDITVTPNHKFPVLDRFKNWKGFYTAEQILNKEIPDQGHCSLFKTGEWVGENDEYFIIEPLNNAEISTLRTKDLREKYSKEIKVPMDIWAKFMGIYLSEGDSAYKRGSCKGGRVNIHQRKYETTILIRELLEEFPLEFKEYNRKDNNHTTFTIFDMRLAKYLQQFGKCYDKFVPYELKKQNKETLRLFYDWFVLGDGRGKGSGKYKNYSDDVFSTSEQLALDLNEIQLKIGFCGSYHEEYRKNDRFIEGRLIEGKNCQNMHFSLRSLTKHITMESDHLKVTEEYYDGYVYCVEVQNNTFYTMCKNGKCLWSGNSSELSGHDVSHNILSLEWVKNTLIGEMELHLSPGYRKYGVISTSGDKVANLLIDNIMIGVSSRGLGSVENKYGDTIVCDDFDLICWDVVVDPSTKGAYIGNNRQELERFVESKNYDRNKSFVNEDIIKIKNILS